MKYVKYLFISIILIFAVSGLVHPYRATLTSIPTIEPAHPARARSPDIMLGDVNLNEIDAIVPVACGSQSMGLVIRCGDKMLVTNMTDLDIPVVEGYIYVFKNPDTNQNTVHRLIHCMDESCTSLLFKGDSNVMPDPIINRSDVTYWVRGIIYS